MIRPGVRADPGSSGSVGESLSHPYPPGFPASEGLDAEWLPSLPGQEWDGFEEIKEGAQNDGCFT